MIKLYDIPTNNQLINIAKSVNDQLNNVKKGSIYITFELSKELLRQIDEEFFFNHNSEANALDFIPSDEVEIIVLGIKFKFIESKGGNQEEVKQD